MKFQKLLTHSLRSEGTKCFYLLSGEAHTGIKLILSAAESYGNIEIQRAALSLIVVVVCGPYRANANNLNLVRSARKDTTSDTTSDTTLDTTSDTNSDTTSDCTTSDSTSVNLKMFMIIGPVPNSNTSPVPL